LQSVIRACRVVVTGRNQVLPRAGGQSGYRQNVSCLRRFLFSPQALDDGPGLEDFVGAGNIVAGLRTQEPEVRAQILDVA